LLQAGRGCGACMHSSTNHSAVVQFSGMSAPPPDDLHHHAERPLPKVPLVFSLKLLTANPHLTVSSRGHSIGSRVWLIWQSRRRRGGASQPYRHSLQRRLASG
jgi:hypothetical protein